MVKSFCLTPELNLGPYDCVTSTLPLDEGTNSISLFVVVCITAEWIVGAQGLIHNHWIDLSTLVASLQLSRSWWISLYVCLSLSLSHTHTHTHTRIHTFFIFHSLSLSLSFTHTHTQTHTHNQNCQKVGSFDYNCDFCWQRKMTQLSIKFGISMFGSSALRFDPN